LEFGGGQSTLWWSLRARSVLTIEDNSGWYAWLSSQTGSNVTLHHLPFIGAIDAIETMILAVKKVLDEQPIRAFDVIIVDGRAARHVDGSSGCSVECAARYEENRNELRDVIAAEYT
jgi:hypothetical protein